MYLHFAFVQKQNNNEILIPTSITLLNYIATIHTKMLFLLLAYHCIDKFSLRISNIEEKISIIQLIFQNAVEFLILKLFWISLYRIVECMILFGLVFFKIFIYIRNILFI